LRYSCSLFIHCLDELLLLQQNSGFQATFLHLHYIVKPLCVERLQFVGYLKSLYFPQNTM